MDRPKRISTTLMLYGFCLLMVAMPCEAPAATDPAKRKRDFNSDWKFILDPLIDASGYVFDDSGWETVSIPHDYSMPLMDSPQQTSGGGVVGPFSIDSEGGAFTGHTTGGVGWYRKTFLLDESDRGKIINVHFDGIYAESEVWINGHKVGFRPNGYVPFYYDLTPFLHIGSKPNVIAVSCRNLGANSRWYAGSGIYRYVHLTVTDPVHVDTWGLHVSTDRLNKKRAKLSVSTTLANRSEMGARVLVLSEIVDHNGVAVARRTKEQDVAAGEQATSLVSLEVNDPRPWSPKDPYRYLVRIALFINGRPVDSVEEKIGIRTIRIDARNGLRINGESVLLKGANIHHDHGFLGARAYSAAEARKVAALKANGFNALRTSHNPPSEALLEACDQLGVMVINEFFDMWERPKKPDDYHQYFSQWHENDLAHVIARDKNRASVMAWSIGNEINERADSSGIAIAKQLVDLTRRLDPTRPVTAGVCDFWDHKGRPWEDTDLAFQFLDVAGYNYGHEHYASDHQRHPQRVMLGTESYAQEAYDNWRKVQEFPYVIGDFIWTGMDYIGEAGIGHSVLDQKAEGNLLPWPWYNAWCGDLDITGSKKPQSYYRDVVWQRSSLEVAVRPPDPQGSVLYTSKWGWPSEQRSWTWPGKEGQPLTLAIYSPGPFVTVTHNGAQVAHRGVDAGSKWITLLEIPYAPGDISVVASDGKRVIARRTLHTTGKPAALRIVADRPMEDQGGDGLIFAHIEVIDEKGNVVPNANAEIALEVNGAGTLIGAGNADPTDLTSFNNPKPKAFQGKAFAVIKMEKGNGMLVFRASAEGLEGAVTFL
ncbi:sugar-binding domain-containing protein [Parapedobacter deserti]|uniref:Sugar-binding domain-containing protein n=1 Tax=Parapedobacter deserti TaxID=1912957 RepID=A0ABV7JPV0_9SPHI